MGLLYQYIYVYLGLTYIISTHKKILVTYGCKIIVKLALAVVLYFTFKQNSIIVGISTTMGTI